jgi:hypothetical protein
MPPDPESSVLLHAGTHDPGYFEHILGLLHSKSLTPSGQSPAKTEDPADLFLGLSCLHRFLAMNQRKNDVMGITGRHHQSNFRDMLRDIGTQSLPKLVSNGRFVIRGCSQLPIPLRF